MSKFITGTNRYQLPLFLIHRWCDKSRQSSQTYWSFVDSLTLPDFGFDFQFVENGRPAYHPSDLLKLYIYGYLNRMHSSRTLEKECGRNIELCGLWEAFSDHNTIANFRKDNPGFFRGGKLASHFELIGGSLVAGDSTKLRAQNQEK
jgi:transposase